jgi:hypothetical protein
MTISGMGDTGASGADCGTNPCTFLDSIYAGWGSPACLPYLTCMDPYDPRVIGAVGAATHGIATDVGAAAAGGANALAGGLNLSGFMLIALAGLALYAFKR